MTIRLNFLQRTIPSQAAILPVTLLKPHQPTIPILAKTTHSHRITIIILYTTLVYKICSIHLSRIPLYHKVVMIMLRVHSVISKASQLTTTTIRMLCLTVPSIHRINHPLRLLAIQQSTSSKLLFKAVGSPFKALIPHSLLQLLVLYPVRTIMLSNNFQSYLKLTIHILDLWQALKLTLNQLKCLRSRKFIPKHRHHNQCSLILIQGPGLSHWNHILRNKFSHNSLLKTILKSKQHSQFILKLCL